LNFTSSLARGGLALTPVQGDGQPDRTRLEQFAADVATLPPDASKAILQAV